MVSVRKMLRNVLTLLQIKLRHFRKFIQDMRTLGNDEALKKYYGVTAQQLLDEVK